MPALAPRSALPYRPVHTEVARDEPPRIARASRTQLQYLQSGSKQDAFAVSPPSASRSMPPKQAYQRKPKWSRNFALGMILMLLIVVAGSLLLGWAQTTWDDLHYGRPRTFQTDAFVGHEAGTVPSHFIALNLQGQIEIIELPGGDATHARMYVGPRIYGPGADLVPVTLRFVDRTHTHHPDMLILFQHAQVLYLNVQGTFRPATP
jgi:hypothetical protein